MVYLKFPDIAIWIIKSLGPLLQLIILALLFISVIIHAAQDQIDHDQKAVQQIPLQKSNQTTWSVPHDFLKKEMEDWESPDSKGRGWGDFNNKFKPWLYLDMESQFTFKTPDLKEKQPELNALHKLRSYLQKKQNLAMLNAAPSSVLGKNNTEDPEAIITPAVKQPNIPGIHKAPSVATQTESQPPSGRDTDSDQSGEKTHQSNNKAFKKIPGGNGGGGGDKDDHFSRQEPPGELVQYTYKVTRTLNIDGKEHEVHGKLNQYNEHLYCAICHDLVSNKVMHTSCCAHNFCRMDFKRLKSKTCPFCGSEKVNFTELNLKSQINLIKWSCSYKSCRYRGNIGEMTDHLLYTCTYRERDPEAVMLAKPVGNTTKIETEINNVLVARFTVDSYYQRDEVNKKSTAAKYGSSRHSNNAVHPISEACNSSSFDGSQTPQPDPLISNYSECAVTPKPSSYSWQGSRLWDYTFQPQVTGRGCRCAGTCLMCRRKSQTPVTRSRHSSAFYLPTNRSSSSSNIEVVPCNQTGQVSTNSHISSEYMYGNTDSIEPDVDVVEAIPCSGSGNQQFYDVSDCDISGQMDHLSITDSNDDETWMKQITYTECYGKTCQFSKQDLPEFMHPTYISADQSVLLVFLTERELLNAENLNLGCFRVSGKHETLSIIFNCTKDREFSITLSGSKGSAYPDHEKLSKGYRIFIRTFSVSKQQNSMGEPLNSSIIDLQYRSFKRRFIGTENPSSPLPELGWYVVEIQHLDQISAFW